MDLSNLLLRILTDTNYQTKNSTLTFLEEDANFKLLADNIKSIGNLNPANFLPYNSSTNYSGVSYVSYNSNVWQYIAAGTTTGITPGTDGTKWQFASVGSFVHQQGTDQYLDFGGNNQVSAANLKTVISNYLDKNTFLNYSGLTNNRLTNIETNYISGATNLGGGLPLYDSEVTANLGFNTLSGGTNITLTKVGNVIYISSGIISLPSGNTSGLAVLNNLSGLSQSLVVGNAGNDFSIYSNGTSHTFNLPSASGTSRGLLTSNDWNFFNSKVDAITLNAFSAYTLVYLSNLTPLSTFYSFTSTTNSRITTVENSFISGATNVGSGQAVYLQTQNKQLQFMRLSGGSNTTITQVGNTIIVDSNTLDTSSKLDIVAFTAYTASAATQFNSKLDKLVFGSYTGSTNNRLTNIETNYISGASNQGNGVNIYNGKNGNILNFNTLSGGTNINISQVGNRIRIDATIPAISGTTQDISGKLDVTAFTAYSGITIGLINQNTSDIVNNASDIAGNTSDIANNTASINSLNTQIANKLDVSAFTAFSGTTLGLIHNNSISINNNTTSINQNTNDIATNTVAITNKLDSNIYSSYSGITNNRLTNIETNFISGATNLGNGFNLFNSEVSSNLSFNTLSGGSNVNLSQVGNVIKIDAIIPLFSATTQDISGKLDISAFTAFSGTTLGLIAGNTTSINTHTTQIANKLDTTAFTSFSGTTLGLIAGNTTAIANNTTAINNHSTQIANKLDTSAFTAFSGTTLGLIAGNTTSINSLNTQIANKLDSPIFSTYSGNTNGRLTNLETTFISGATNLGNGTGIFNNKVGNTLNFNTISGGSNITISQVGNVLRIDNNYTAATVNTSNKVDLSAFTIFSATTKARIDGLAVGAYIPLSGTTYLNPVTGDLQFADNVVLKSVSYPNNYISVRKDDGFGDFGTVINSDLYVSLNCYDGNSTSNITLNQGSYIDITAQQLNFNGQYFNLSYGTQLFFNSNSIYGVGLKAASGITSYLNFTLPNTLGTNGQVMTTDGHGNMIWANVSSATTNISGKLDVTAFTAFSGTTLGLINTNTTSIAINTTSINTLNTQIANKLDVSAFTAFSGTSLGLIAGNTSQIATNTTAINTLNTQIANKLDISAFTAFSGTTLGLIAGNTTSIAGNTTAINTLNTQIANKLDISAFTAFSGSTIGLINTNTTSINTLNSQITNKLDSTLFSTYSGLTNNRLTNLETNFISGATNLGGGINIFNNKAGNNLTFNTLSAGTNVTLSQVGNIIRINSTATGGGGGTSYPLAGLGISAGTISDQAQDIYGSKTFYNNIKLTDSSFLISSNGSSGLYFNSNGTASIYGSTGTITFDSNNAWNTYSSGVFGHIFDNFILVSNLAGAGNRMAIILPNGQLSATTIPTGGGGGISGATNLGSGLGIYSSIAGGIINFNTISGGTNNLISQVGNLITIDSTQKPQVFNGNLSASTGFARAMRINPTLYASANNDTLLGLDLAPTFSAGTFTGVTSIAMRLVNGASIIPSTNNTSSLGANGLGMNTVWANLVRAGSSSLNLSSNGTGSAILFQLGGTSTASFYGTTGNLQLGGTFGTDAGYKLDVQGTARFASGVTFGLFSGGSTNQMAVILPNGQLSATTMPVNSGGGVSGATNLGLGLGIYSSLSGGLLNFNTISGGSNVTLSQVGNIIRIDATAGSTTSPAGSNTQIQFNNSGVFGASSGLTYNGNNLSLGNGNGLILSQPGNGSPKLFNQSNIPFGSDIGSTPTFYPTSVTNGAVNLQIVPKGSGVINYLGSQLSLYTTDYVADSTNYEALTIQGLINSEFRFNSGAGGTGTTRPITFYINSTQALKINTDTTINIASLAGGSLNKTMYVLPSGQLSATTVASGWSTPTGYSAVRAALNTSAMTFDNVVNILSTLIADLKTSNLITS